MKHLLYTSALLIALATALAHASTIESWKKAEDAAVAAIKAARFSEAEKLLVSNEKSAESFPPKDARLPKTVFDLAQLYRAEGRYSEALPLYERALQIYTSLYGPESQELAETLNGEAELYKSVEDYGHAEPLLIKSLDMRQRIVPVDEADVAQSKNDLGELYTQTAAYDKAEQLLSDALASRKKAGAESYEVAQTFQGLGLLYEKTRRAK